MASVKSDDAMDHSESTSEQGQTSQQLFSNQDGGDSLAERSNRNIRRMLRSQERSGSASMPTSPTNITKGAGSKFNFDLPGGMALVEKALQNDESFMDYLMSVSEDPDLAVVELRSRDKRTLTPENPVEATQEENFLKASTEEDRPSTPFESSHITTSPISVPTKPKYKEKASVPATPSTAMKHSISWQTRQAKIGLNHLDNLCRLMEQLSDLKDQNTVLQRRVQYLEDVRVLNGRGKPEMDQMLAAPDVCVSIVEPSSGAGADVEDEPWWSLYGFHSKSSSSKATNNQFSKKSLLKVDNRIRSKSTGQNAREVQQEQNGSQGSRSSSATKGKISKWAKVKEAFKWEKVGVDQRNPKQPTSSAPMQPQFSSKKKPPVAHLRVPTGQQNSDHSDWSPDFRSVDINFCYSPTGSNTSSSEDTDWGPNWLETVRLGAYRQISLPSSESGDEQGHKRIRHSGGSLPSLVPQKRYSQPDGRDQNYNEASTGGARRKFGNEATRKSTWGKVKSIIQYRKESFNRKRQGSGGSASGRRGSTGRRGNSGDREKKNYRDNNTTSASGIGFVSKKSGTMSRVDTPPGGGDSSEFSHLKAHADYQNRAPSPARNRPPPAPHGTTESPKRRRSKPERLSVMQPSLFEDPSSQHSSSLVRQSERASAFHKQLDNVTPAGPGADYAEDGYGRNKSMEMPRERPPAFQKSRYQMSSSVGAGPTKKALKELQATAGQRQSKWNKVKKAFLGATGTSVSSSGSAAASGTGKSMPTSPYLPSDDFHHGYAFPYEEGREKKSPTPVVHRKDAIASTKSPPRIDQPDETSMPFQNDASFDHGRTERENPAGSSSGYWDPFGGKTEAHPGRHSRHNLHPSEEGSPRPRHRASESGLPLHSAYQAYAESIQKNLTEDFTRKLDEWEKMKSSGVHKMSQIQTARFPQDFTKKLQEWEKRNQQPRKKQDATPRRAEKKSGSSGEGFRERVVKGVGQRQRKEHKFSKPIREKDMAWLEKELEKIEREKQRLEREREKFLRREARLEQIRLALRSPRDDGEEKEILVRTSSGALLRFAGIDRSFARRLLEWEERQGISPEASAMALLHAPPAHRFRDVRIVSSKPRVQDLLDPNFMPWNGSAPVGRSRSEGSILDAASNKSRAGGASFGATNRASFGSLDSRRERPTAGSSRGHSEPEMPALSEDLRQNYSHSGDRSDDDFCKQRCDLADKDDSCALVVDVEELVEESKPILPPALAAGILVDAPARQPPLVTSSGPEVEEGALVSNRGRHSQQMMDATDNSSETHHFKSRHTYSNLLGENIDLIEQLQANEASCRKIHAEIEELKSKLEHVGWHRKELGEKRARVASTSYETPDQTSDSSSRMKEANQQEALRHKIEELDAFHEKLKHDKEQLEVALQDCAKRRESLAQALVGKIEELAENGSISGNTFREFQQRATWDSGHRTNLANSPQPSELSKVERMSAELLQQARQVEAQLTARNREIRNLHLKLVQKGMYHPNEHGMDFFSRHGQSHQGRSWSSIEAVQATALSKLLLDAGYDDADDFRHHPWDDELPGNHELSRRVRELKDELLKLWSVQDWSEHQGPSRHLSAGSTRQVDGWRRERSAKLERESQAASAVERNYVTSPMEPVANSSVTSFATAENHASNNAIELPSSFYEPVSQSNHLDSGDEEEPSSARDCRSDIVEDDFDQDSSHQDFSKMANDESPSLGAEDPEDISDSHLLTRESSPESSCAEFVLQLNPNRRSHGRSAMESEDEVSSAALSHPARLSNAKLPIASPPTVGIVSEIPSTPTTDRTRSSSIQSSDASFMDNTESKNMADSLANAMFGSSQELDDPSCYEFFLNLQPASPRAADRSFDSSPYLADAEGLSGNENLEESSCDEVQQVTLSIRPQRRMSKDMLSRQGAFDDGRGVPEMAKQASGASEDTYKASDSPTGTTVVTLSRQNSQSSATFASLDSVSTLDGHSGGHQSQHRRDQMPNRAPWEDTMNSHHDVGNGSSKEEGHTDGQRNSYISTEGISKIIDSSDVVPTRTIKICSPVEDRTTAPSVSRVLFVPPVVQRSSAPLNAARPNRTNFCQTRSDFSRIFVPTIKAFFGMQEEGQNDPSRQGSDQQNDEGRSSAGERKPPPRRKSKRKITANSCEPAEPTSRLLSSMQRPPDSMRNEHHQLDGTKEAGEVPQGPRCLLPPTSPPAAPPSPSTVRSMVERYNKIVKECNNRRFGTPTLEFLTPPASSHGSPTAAFQTYALQPSASAPNVPTRSAEVVTPEPSPAAEPTTVEPVSTPALDRPRRPPTLHLPPPPQRLPGMTSVSPEVLSAAAPVKRTPSNRLRAWKIRRARDEFLNQGPLSPFAHYSRHALPPSSPDDELDPDALDASYRSVGTNPSFRRQKRPEPVAEENRYSTGSNCSQISSQSAGLPEGNRQESLPSCVQPLTKSSSMSSLQESSTTIRRQQSRGRGRGLPPPCPTSMSRGSRSRDKCHDEGAVGDVASGQDSDAGSAGWRRRRISPLSPSRIREFASRILKGGIKSKSNKNNAGLECRRASRDHETQQRDGAVRALCRQSLLVDVASSTDDDEEGLPQTDQLAQPASRRTAPVKMRSCPSSPVQKTNRDDSRPLSPAPSAVEGYPEAIISTSHPEPEINGQHGEGSACAPGSNTGPAKGDKSAHVKRSTNE